MDDIEQQNQVFRKSFPGKLIPLNSTVISDFLYLDPWNIPIRIYVRSSRFESLTSMIVSVISGIVF